ncbi:CHK domain-containing protein [Aphelenchoides fujianensis]|nr:CHK domain-containing protein [Aphelenchoides fujianensis]
MPESNGDDKKKDEKKKEPSIEEVLKENNYSKEWLLEHMDKNDAYKKAKGDRELKKAGIHVKNIGDGKGYCAQVFRVTFEFDGSGEQDEFKVVMKIPTDEKITETFDEDELTDEIAENLRELAWQLHDREVQAFDVLKEIRSTGYPLPDVYGSDHHGEERPGILLMEDMSGRGVNVEALDSLSAEQCAFVELLPNDSWSDNFKDSVHIRKENEKEIKKKLKPVLEFRPEEQKGMVQSFMDLDIYEFCKHALRDVSEEKKASSLQHGDAWSHNVLFEKNEDGSISDRMTGILDWATCFEGNPLFDIARFMITCTDGEIRRECLPRVLDAYYNRLKEASP